MSGASVFPTPGPLTNANANGRIIMASLALLCSVILFILALHIYAKCFWRRARLRQAALWRQHLHIPVQPAVTAGLDEAVINSLPTFFLELSQKGAMECAVCLSDLQESDKGKVLPKCGHSFHAKCIDMWLLSCATCPLCRTSTDAADSKRSSNANADQPALIVTHPDVRAAFHSSNDEGDGNADALPSPGWRWRRSASDRFSQRMHTGVQFPTNVLFWGNHSQVSSHTNCAEAPVPHHLDDGQNGARSVPHMSLDIPRATQAPMAARSSSSRACEPCPSWHAETRAKTAASGLSMFIRLLSRERKISPAER